MFFQKGDIIRAKSTGYKATIIDTNIYHNKIMNVYEMEYTVKWEHFLGANNNGGVAKYTHTDVVNEWELVAQTLGAPFHERANSVQDDINESFPIDAGIEFGCKVGNHKWKNYNSGWTTYDYCEDCGKRKDSV